MIHNDASPASPRGASSNAADCLRRVEEVVSRMVLPRPTSNVNISLRDSLAAQLEAASRESSLHFAMHAPEPLRSRLQGSPLSIDPSNVASHLRRRTSQWQGNVVEALDRLSRDWRLLVEMRYAAADAALASVSPPLGDPHNQGRFVLKLTFDDGRALMYKPRSVSAERSFADVVDVLARSGCQPTLSSCRVLPRDTYGWAEFVGSLPAEDEQDIAHFYQRQGGFLALFWLLGGSDATPDNIVVHGSHPMWVDTECMCAPELPPSQIISNDLPMWIKDSVLSTGMLVMRHTELARLERRDAGLSVSCTRERGRVFSGEQLTPRYVEAVVEGFQQLYTWLLNHHDILTPDGPILSPWLNAVIRYLPRDSRYYATLLSWSLLAPSSDSTRRRLHQLADSLLSDAPQFHSFVESELAALQRGDIPYFVTSPYATDVWEAGGSRVASVATAKGMDCIHRRVARMDKTDRDRQAWLISSYIGHAAEPSTTR
jgi:lantibiotic modifying enzyme